jgi:hypothetical protein
VPLNFLYVLQVHLSMLVFECWYMMWN